jgi:hypothetical protein
MTSTAEQHYNFLRKWSKGKIIRRVAADTSFHSAGKWMTKIDQNMIDELVSVGYATYEDDVLTLKVLK